MTTLFLSDKVAVRAMDGLIPRAYGWAENYTTATGEPAQLQHWLILGTLSVMPPHDAVTFQRDTAHSFSTSAAFLNFARTQWKNGYRYAKVNCVMYPGPPTASSPLPPFPEPPPPTDRDPDEPGDEDPYPEATSLLRSIGFERFDPATSIERRGVRLTGWVGKQPVDLIATPFTVPSVDDRVTTRQFDTGPVLLTQNGIQSWLWVEGHSTAPSYGRRTSYEHFVLAPGAYAADVVQLRASADPAAPTSLAAWKAARHQAWVAGSTYLVAAVNYYPTI